ncbi:MAG: FtsX-like permease family protein [Luteitalea sp.]|nr:FtsX-like permease family protein [Luteitalea sp.]
MRRLNLVEDLWKDVGHAVRVLRRSPGFTAVAVLTLALGIGANTAIFSVVYGVLLKPLSLHQPDRLLAVWLRAPGLNIPLLEQGPATYFTYRETGRVFEDIALWDATQVSVTERGEPERAQALRVTDGLLPLLRVQPLLGRTFTKEDDAPGSPLRVILMHGYWQRRFGGAPDAVGQSLNVDGQPHEVIGVLPRSFTFPRTAAAVLLPFQLNRAEVVVGTDFSYQAIARLKPRVTLEQANADVARMIPLMFDRFPLPPGATRKMFDEVRLGPNVHPLSADVIGDADRVLWILFGTVGLVLLIACANVANLFLVRTEGRQQELAIRAALGASRGRMARELLSESVGLALAGGAVGVALAFAGTGLLAWMAPPTLRRIDEIAIDPVVLLFTLALSVLTGLVFGLIPVMRFWTPNVAALKEGGRSASDAPWRHRARNVLVVSEVALAVVLLVVSGLMIRTFVALRQVDPGFVRPEEVQTFRVSIPEALVEDPQQAVRTYEQIAQRLEQVPGVISVGLSSSVTMDGIRRNGSLFVEDFSEASRGPTPLRRDKRIAPGYFETMGNPVLVGRAITWADSDQARPVAIVSESLAREYWHDPAEAIGKRIREGLEGPWREIIGVVGNERDDGLNQPAPAIVYWPMLMREFENSPISMARNVAYVVRSDRMGSPSFLRELQQAVWSVNPNLPLANVRTLEEIRANSMAQTSFTLVMLAIAAGVALLLGIVGIYGVVAYIAAQRTREIGIRMALGAQTGDVRRLFLRHGFVLTLAGIVLGIGAAMLLTRVMSSLLFGVGPTDPLTYVVVTVSLTSVALLATYLPARRASRIDPIIALRSEI